MSRKHEEEKSSISKNFIMNILLTMSSFIFPLITFPYISRVLLPEGIGKVSFANSVVSYFVMLSQLGIPIYGIRACARVRDNKEELSKVSQELLIISLIMSLFSFILLIIAVFSFPKLRGNHFLYFVLSSTIFLSAIGMEWLYKALEQYTYITIRSLIFKIVSIIAMFIFVKNKNDYIKYGGITVIASSASYVFNIFNAHKFIDFKLYKNINLKRHIKPILIFFAMSCATIIYTNIDVVMLGIIRTDIDVGYYNAAVKIKCVLTSVVTSLGAVLLPRASYFIKIGEKEKFYEYANVAMHFVFLIASPLVVYFILFASPLIQFISGEQFFGAIVPMQILMPTVLLIGITNVLGIQILIPMGKENMVLISEIVGAVIDMLFNGFWIPRYGVAGASFATLIAELAVFIVQFVSLFSIKRIIFGNIKYFKIFFSSLLCAIASCIFYKKNWNCFMILSVSSILFMVLYFFILYLLNDSLIHKFVHALQYHFHQE